MGAQGGGSTSMRATVLYAYQANAPDQLTLYPGDVVDVMQTGQDWWTGTLRGQTGLFPANFVEMMRGGAGRDPRDEETIAYISERLQEPQVRIVRAVVDHLGSATALELLEMTERTQAAGGMFVPETGKPRTSGGIYFKLLKDATNLPREAQQAALQRIKVEGKKVKSWEKAQVPGWS